jgi:hypothetical protein
MPRGLSQKAAAIDRKFVDDWEPGNKPIINVVNPMNYSQLGGDYLNYLDLFGMSI